MSLKEKALTIHRALFRNISRGTTEEDLNEIKKELKHPDFGGFGAGEIQRYLKTTEDVLQKLENKGKIKIGDYKKLRKLAETLGLQPILNFVAQAEDSLDAIDWPVNLPQVDAPRGDSRPGPMDNRASRPSTMAKRQKTGETTETPRDDTQSTSGQTSNLTLELSKVITKVADAISNDDDLMRLGLELGVEQQHIDRALATNWNGGEKTSHGNLVMLQNWAKKVKQSEQLPTLRAALRKTKLIGVEESCLPIEGSITSGQYEDSVLVPANIPFDFPTEYEPGRGYVLFINNFFTGKKGQRKGAEFDEKNINNLFKNVLKDYHLEYKKDVSLKELEDYLKDVKDTLLKGIYKSFIFMLGTHGAPKTVGPDGRMKDGVQMADGEWMSVEKIVSNFHGDQIPAMKDKPKVFIIQSCRGDKMQPSVQSSDNAETVSNEKTKNDPQPDFQPAYRPVNSDILIAYATSEGTLAWRNEEEGSWFVTDLCEVITECYDKENMVNILIRVNGRMVCREEKTKKQERIKQMPCFLCTFTRQFMLAYPIK
ncbi:uncharacterized protein LOC100891245 isoform X2 [Strongylocentrotus purpuratus]|uniref:Uncharacterized protein n=1 Tax=Strongylocentrotus purpuratus TaxID=7668 RepID=A0A7M7T4P0_STRPU|nr:uncharacterized protein LOC100891245 isoform X2 [Strongylocentrotus purpuratus]